MDEVALRLASSGAELASALEEPTALPDSFTEQDLLALNGIVQAAADADTFVSKPSASLDQCRQSLQSLYRLVADGLGAQASAQNANAGTQLPPNKLVVANFHVEQIWGQLDMLTEVAMKRARKGVKSSKDTMHLLDPSMEEAVDELIATAMGLPVEKGSSDSEGSAGDLGGDIDHPRELSALDYELMLQSGSTHKKVMGGRSHGDSEDDTSDADDVIDDHDDDADDVNIDTGSQGSDEQAAAADGQGKVEGEELLPVEDDFLRLDDMEAFVQHAEAAHAAGDTGGFDTFQDHLEGNELGGRAATNSLNRPQKKHVHAGNLGGDSDSDSQDEPGAEGGTVEGGSEDEVDLYTAFDSDAEEQDGRRAAGRSGDVSYEEFFGRKEPYSAQKRPKGPWPEEQQLTDEQAADKTPPEGDDHNNKRADEHEDNQIAFALSTKNKGKGFSAAEEAQKGSEGVLSSHEKKQLRMAREIEKVEGELIADKSWQFRGEATAKQRPKDSALEIDLDFDRTMRPPPQPTLEAAAKLEDIIKQRILDLRFDNVVRVNVEAPEKTKAKTKAQVELQDQKAKEGLADEYAKEYHATVAGVAEDRNAKLRAEVKTLYAQLAAKLDALSHLSLTPKPVITELEVARDMPAIAMEEAAPVATSLAAMQAPEEAHAKVKERALKAEDEKTQSERHADRAAKKRVSKRKKLQAEEAQGVWGHEKGIKSAREDAQAAREAAEMNRKGSKKFKSGKTDTAGKSATPKTAIATNSSAVFKALEAAKSKDGPGGSGGPKKGSEQRSAKFMY